MATLDRRSGTGALYVCVLVAALIACMLAAQYGLPLVILWAVGCASLVLIARPDVATLAVVFLIYSNVPAVATNVHGLPLAFAAAVPLALGIPVVYYVLIRRDGFLIPRITGLVCALLVVQFMGSLLSSQPVYAVNQTITEGLLEGLVLFLMVVNAVRSPRMLRQVIRVMLIAGALLGSLGLYQRVTATYENNYWGFAQINRDTKEQLEEDPLYKPSAKPRQAGPIGVENRYAHLMLMLIPLGLFQYRNERRRWSKLATIVVTALIAIGIALTQSRGALIGFVLMGLAMVGLGYVRWKHAVWIAIALVLIVAMFPDYRTRLLRVTGVGGLFASDVQAEAIAHDRNIMGRANEAVTAILVFLDHPIIGAGHSMFPYHYEDYSRHAGFVQHSGRRGAHNFYLGLAAEHGLVGLACMLGVLVTTLFMLERSRRKWATSDPARSNLAAAFFLAIIAFMAVGLFAGFAYVRYFWLLMGLATVATGDGQAENASPDATERGD